MVQPSQADEPQVERTQADGTQTTMLRSPSSPAIVEPSKWSSGERLEAEEPRNYSAGALRVAPRWT